MFATDVSEPLMDPSKYSSWIRLIRATAWLMRFVAKLSTKVKKRDNLPEAQMKESLTPTELDEARDFWVKQAQSELFPEEVQDLNRGKEVRKESHLKALTPIMDKAGVLGVGRRLTRAALPYDAIHPMILGKLCVITSETSPLGFGWSSGSEELRQRLSDVRKAASRTSSADNGTSPGIQTWNNHEGICEILC